MNGHDTQENKKVPVIMTWLGHEGLRLVPTLTDSEQEKYKRGSEQLKCEVRSSDLSTMR